jgi:hypothetical protein
LDRYLTYTCYGIMIGVTRGGVPGAINKAALHGFLVITPLFHCRYIVVALLVHYCYTLQHLSIFLHSSTRVKCVERIRTSPSVSTGWRTPVHTHTRPYIHTQAQYDCSLQMFSYCSDSLKLLQKCLLAGQWAVSLTCVRCCKATQVTSTYTLFPFFIQNHCHTAVTPQ